MNKKLATTVKKSFDSHFKTNPILVFSPGRINLIGEHTDYNDGYVFPAAINKGIVLALQKNNSEVCEIHALNKNEIHQFKIDSIEPAKTGGWKNYVLGVISELKILGLKTESFNAVFAGNIPEGAGLSSSAALENSFVYGLNELFDFGLTKDEMILISQRAEHNFVGVKCGIMDQFASMFGVKESAIFLDCRTLKFKSYNIDLKNYQLMLINTNVKHDLSETAYNDRRKVCENISDLLNVKALRDVSYDDLDSIKNRISEHDYQKALFVIEENTRVKEFASAISENDLNTMGYLLYESHEGLRKQHKVSCTELDFLVEAIKNNPNILGSRMMGGGFGGCTINLVLKSEFKKLKSELSNKYSSEFGKKCTIYDLRLSQGTDVLK